MDDQQLNIRQAPFLFLSSHPNDYFRKAAEQLRHPGTPEDHVIFRNTFLSEPNVAYINNKIKKQVYEKSCNKYIIPDQKYEHMFLVMKQIYDSYATHINAYKREELKMLNDVTIDFCSKAIVEEITHKYRYLKFVYAKPTTMPDPINTSIKGTRSYATDLNLDEEPYDYTKEIKDVDVYSRTITMDETKVDNFCGRNPLWN
jgi:hypothetical protein